MKNWKGIYFKISIINIIIRYISNKHDKREVKSGKIFGIKLYVIT